MKSPDDTILPEGMMEIGVQKRNDIQLVYYNITITHEEFSSHKQ